MASTTASAPIRVAFEGCGHGCLNDIYASVEKAATLKGWDGVDLLIIGGDFQAVRNSNDMACMSVPQKFKELGDFHEYYSGQRTAPYLTVFIGGNHEAGNHLFELYYGGWVAPNIYYMGAANVLRCGPLRIAAMSGIWKGYDYRKSHFERLPYNKDDVQSIYHVRELDVRKLLQIRTQVDLGLSHDWPKQIENYGDYETLFNIKRGFRQDSQEGKLGNTAAKYVLDRLRPAYWFSAHLHVKFAACLQHEDYVIPEHPETKRQVTAAQRNTNNCLNAASPFGFDGALVTTLLGEEDEEDNKPLLARTPNEPLTEANLVQDSQQEDHVTADNHSRSPKPESVDSKPTENSNVCTNDTESKLSAWNNFHAVAARNEAIENSRYLSEQRTVPEIQHNLTWKKINVDDDSGRKLAGIERENPTASVNKRQKTQHEQAPVKNTDEIDLDLDSDSGDDVITVNTPITASQRAAESSQIASVISVDGSRESMKTEPVTKVTVSDDVRNQLPASFSRPQPDPRPVNGPSPEDISNKTTRFLALDKCLPNREFLQLVEFETISDPKDAQCERPYRLQYDKEWLAITRVFAKDLQLGDPRAKPPPDLGDIVYKPLIVEEEKWVEENIIKSGKMNVPDNFVPTAPFYDPSIPVTTSQMPPEYTNPQTSQFCELIGIENKFHLSDEERQSRMAAGPRPSEPRGNFRHSHRGGFGRGRGGGRGGRGYGRGRGGR
ncbi:lariat debranching enzyme, C-terminal domain-containing protein [Aspergillus avenaceus]|uniref:Lariat debranching enzyme, C-terminal domain-containing protein n=1 Tax=Aspergillus avenaceus TaxID=36643 RepID=A0A5N6U2Z7_ASPAV|nr:lariat debranching enzyme, C-terminal domain-containing protein [Aspergillus avenaceus]